MDVAPRVNEHIQLVLLRFYLTLRYTRGSGITQRNFLNVVPRLPQYAMKCARSEHNEYKFVFSLGETFPKRQA